MAVSKDNEKRDALQEYAHALSVAAVAKARYMDLCGKPCDLRIYIDEEIIFQDLAQMFGVHLMQKTVLPTLRVFEFTRDGLTWVHGVSR